MDSLCQIWSECPQCAFLFLFLFHNEIRIWEAPLFTYQAETMKRTICQNVSAFFSQKESELEKREHFDRIFAVFSVAGLIFKLDFLDIFKCT